MADKEVVDLTAAAAFGLSDIFHIVQGGNSREGSVQQIVDAVRGAYSGAMVKKSADETTANYSAGAMVPWTAEVHDVGAYHDNATNNSRLTVPADGKYMVGFTISVSLAAVGEYVRAFVAFNGSLSYDGVAGTLLETTNAAVNPSLCAVTGPIDCTAGQYFESWLDTEADTSITVLAATSNFWIRRVP
jgi:hypothetical protein